MRILCLLLGFVTSSLIGHAANARTYVPIGTIGPGEFLPVKVADRPHLPGLRSVDLELLEDALRRKQPISVGNSRDKAQQSIIRNSLRNPIKQSHTLGILAEAVFLEKNSHWGYVSSPNAPQNDVYTWISGERKPFTAQIKTHVSGNPIIYASDMKKDYLAARFVVPDDHVAALRKHWELQEQISHAQGRVADATDARRQLARIQPLGASYSELSSRLSRATRSAQREQYAGYVSVGTSIGLALGPLAWAALQNQVTPDQALLGLAHQGALVGVERGVNFALARNTRSLIPSTNFLGYRPGAGALKGSLRGNAMTGAALLVADTAFSVFANGGQRAFQNVGFYTSLGGSVSATSLGMLAGWSATWGTGGNPYIGLIAGVTVGALANVGGRAATKRVLEGIGPNFLYMEDDAALNFERMEIHKEIQALKTL